MGRMSSPWMKRFLPLGVLVLVLHGAAHAAKFSSGPMIGHTTHTSATFWAQSTGGGTLTVQVSEKADLSGALQSNAVKFDKDRDRTAIVEVKGLKPRTTYYWQAFIDGKPYEPPKDAAMRFRTFPEPGAKTKFRFGMGSCNSVLNHPGSDIWKGVLAEDLDAFIWLGDNIYVDRQPAPIVSSVYRKARREKYLVPVLLSTPHYAIWDDHEFGDNNEDRDLKTKDTFLELFKDWWANESYGEPDNPGVYSKVAMGPLDMFLLDCRYHRAPNDDPPGPEKTMLGKRQLQWLKDGLVQSTAEVKMLACGSAWNDNTYFDDNWASHKHERDHLFDFIQQKNIKGVVLLSGDTHVGELNAVPRTKLGGYDLYEFVASPLANGNDPVDIYMKSEAKRLRPVDGAGYNFGVVTVDTASQPATVSYELVRAGSQRVWEKFTVPVNELENGKGNWTKYVGDMGQWEGIVNQ